MLFLTVEVYLNVNYLKCNLICAGMRTDRQSVLLRSDVHADPAFRKLFEADGIRKGRSDGRCVAQYSGIPYRLAWHGRNRDARVISQSNLHCR